jgi:uncharacterized protein YigA (DUF484 family)
VSNRQKIEPCDTAMDQEVAEYLGEHPEFFARHPELLADLRIPHAGTGRAISLIERQVQVLRERRHTLERELRQFVTIARQNDQLNGCLHRFALAMLEARHFDDVLSTAQDMLRHEFRLDAITIRLRGGPEGHAAAVEPGDRRLDELLERVGTRPVCDARPDAAMLDYLFGAQGSGIQSSALVALGARTGQNASALRGLLALGSQDPLRFRPDMGTTFLVQLGETLFSALASRA